MSRCTAVRDVIHRGAWPHSPRCIFPAAATSGDGTPVATVNVTLSPGGHSTVTGSDGSFSFNELEPREYTVSISKEGYTPTTDKVIVKAGQATSAHLLIERIPASITADRTLLDFDEKLKIGFKEEEYRKKMEERMANYKEEHQ